MKSKYSKMASQEIWMEVRRTDDSEHNLMGGGVCFLLIFVLCLVARKRLADLNQKEQTKRNKYALKNKSVILL